jgi:3-oxoacyl-(acyl-carrier-protein) synthase
MHHFTNNQADGSGFAICAGAMAGAARGRKVWVKGHGTGTLEAGRLEAGAFARALPGAPLVSWKGSLGHTLGSCGLVELALVLAAMQAGRAPGTVGTTGPTFTDTVALASFPTGDCHGVIVASNAFGGAHAALLLSHE